MIRKNEAVGWEARHPSRQFKLSSPTPFDAYHAKQQDFKHCEIADVETLGLEINQLKLTLETCNLIQWAKSS